ncbi:hypothetical protein VPH35_030336 [Triticum aestivum]
MDSTAFFWFVAARHKRSMQPALRCCLDPGKSVMNTITDVFPMDRLELKNLQPLPGAWACMLIQEETVQTLPSPPIPGDHAGTTLAAGYANHAQGPRPSPSRDPLAKLDGSRSGSQRSLLLLAGNCPLANLAIKAAASRNKGPHSRLLCAADRTG